MNTTFPRIITLLRKERGISQKKAAGDLDISQALLSHYEKGIRECGLDFVVRVADYYSVSCDYLLGRTADKSGTTISVDDIPDTPDSADKAAAMSAVPVLSKKLIINSLHIVFDLLQRCDNKGVTAEASTILTLAVYSAFRHVFAANAKNPDAMFSIPDELFRPATAAEIVQCSGRLTLLCSGRSCHGYEPLAADKAPLILPDNLSREYPLFASSLFNLLKNAEALLEYRI